jgi:hypothetical protein
VPYSNVSKKHIHDNNYNTYLENLGENSNLKNKAGNMTFINGDIAFDKTSNGEFLLEHRPFIRTLHLELIE